ncbi:MAG: hypothetical protein K6F61_04140 [Clostridiales bacterium]|nr:hypothetical protein [Clostridiales bacterium]
MANYIHITESLFLAIKSLLNAGATYPEVKKYYGISDNTCRNIRHAETFAEYKQIIAAIAAKNSELKKARKIAKAKKAAEEVKAVPASELPVPEPDVKPVQVVEHKQSITIQATHYMMQEMQETNKLLKDISNKLAFIVEQLS